MRGGATFKSPDENEFFSVETLKSKARVRGKLALMRRPAKRLPQGQGCQ